MSKINNWKSNPDDWDDDDDTAAANVDLDEVVTVQVCEDTICPVCIGSRIIQNFLYPHIFCCIDCGLIFNDRNFNSHS